MANNENQFKAEILLVGFISNGDKSILTVGTPQPGGTSEVINAYQGEAAIALYNTLISSSPEDGEEGKEDDVQRSTDD